ncbi:DNA mismatch repair protein MutS [Nitrosomonas sp. Nm166]|uniref:MutS-related protein n=1 Tax=Nitrosomonas sp. Nm166 TaxID=1881054 RepID=UPI0008E275A8|nr:DNA mismatch repair protein MutS [Nitrosomonas sp. Nm166]SFE60633.1 MutS domain V [Nitrosomonas sp. Nm166]
MNDIWRKQFILSDSDRPTRMHDIRPTQANYEALDPKTFEAIEVEALFDAIDHTQTEIGRLVLYRSMARPDQDAQVLQQKQIELREIESNPELYDALAQFVGKVSSGEKLLKHLLYGEFSGGLATDEPSERSDRLEFGGYGYQQFKDGTQFAVDLVESASRLPHPQSIYLRTLLDAICDFGQSRIYALMKGPVYSSGGKFKTKKEKTNFDLYSRFRPSLLKMMPTLIFFAALYGILFFFENFMPQFNASYIGYGILALTLPIFPIVLLAMGVSDRDSIIYPLRKQFRESMELAKAIEALGLIDELLSFYRYGQSLTSDKVLPEILDEKQHRLIVNQARNPLLIKVISDYVPNDIRLELTDRLLIITGPNSGGKTAYCKTVAQIQLLGQIGCYIPATQGQLVPAEHIFYQVPEPGQLSAAMGRFGHELKRTREIFFNATARSLVVLDELSEGTTFEEKMTISEYILKGFHKLGASTLLVTHNHELCERLQSEGIGQYLQVEFMPEGPTHRLIAGISTVSHADRVAHAIGFSQKHVEAHLERQADTRQNLGD